MSKEAVASPQAPSAIGPYSPAIRSGNLLFVSGQIPLDPATGAVVDGGFGGRFGTPLVDGHAVSAGDGHGVGEQQDSSVAGLVEGLPDDVLEGGNAGCVDIVAHEAQLYGMNRNPEENAWDEEEDLGPSKSARKREAHALQKLGEHLVTLKETELAQLPLPDTLLEAIREARRLKNRGALHRQRGAQKENHSANGHSDPLFQAVHKQRAACGEREILLTIHGI